MQVIHSFDSVLCFLHSAVMEVDQSVEDLQAKVIQSCEIEIVECLEAVDILPCLTCLSSNDKDKIKNTYHSETRQEAARMVVDCLVRKKAGSFYKDFILGLEKQKLKHIINLLNEKLTAGRGIIILLHFYNFHTF